jgi:organic hydroperoxide reductase OsmC/OhrA
MQGHCFQMDIIHIQTKNKKVATSAPVQKSRLKKYYGNMHGSTHRLRTPNKGINQRYLKNWADVADKICFGRT